MFKRAIYPYLLGRASDQKVLKDSAKSILSTATSGEGELGHVNSPLLYPLKYSGIYLSLGYDLIYIIGRILMPLLLFMFQGK